jgi:CAAX protease family protein
MAYPFNSYSIRLFQRAPGDASEQCCGCQGPISHGALLRGYVLNIALEWGMAYWAWAGVHWKGGNLDTLTGGRWTSWRSLLADVAIAVPFCIVWELTAWAVHLAVDRVNTPTAPYQPPSGFTEISLWILLSISAGVCEEIMYRGYLQRQVSAATRSLAAGVILQGACSDCRTPIRAGSR